MRQLYLSTCAALLLAAVGTAQAQVAIVNAERADLIDRAQLRDILLGRVSTWADGSQVVLILSDDPLSRGAIERLTGRDLDRLVRGWKRILFSGNGAMPIIASSSAVALNEVGQHRGAIAIVGDEQPVGFQVKVALPLHGPVAAP